MIPKRYRDVSFDRPPVTEIDERVVAEVGRYVRSIDERLDAGRGIWFMGDVGTGKTTLAMLISSAALQNGRSVAIYSLPRLLAELRKTFDEGAAFTHLELIDSLAAVDLLHIDDLGLERAVTTPRDSTPPAKLSTWAVEQLYSIINARYENERALTITMNLTPDELAEQIGDRSVSRLVEMCGDPLTLFGHDRRREPEIPEHLRAAPHAGPQQASPEPGATPRYGEPLAGLPWQHGH